LFEQICAFELCPHLLPWSRSCNPATSGDGGEGGAGGGYRLQRGRSSRKEEELFAKTVKTAEKMFTALGKKLRKKQLDKSEQDTTKKLLEGAPGWLVKLLQFYILERQVSSNFLVSSQVSSLAEVF
jgi:hypothetical protein